MVARLTTVGVALVGAVIGSGAANPRAGAPTRSISVAVGDGSVDGSRVTPYQTEWIVTTVTPDGRDVANGHWFDRVSIVDFRGGKAFMREQVYANPAPPRQNQMFTVWVDPRTFAPLATNLVGVDGSSTRRDFSALEVDEHALDPAKGFAIAERHFALSGKVFDFSGGLFGILLAAMPLEVGDQVTFPVLTETDPPVAGATVATVRGEETVDAGLLGRLKTLTVQLSDGRSRYTFWIAKSAPYIIQLTVQGPAGGQSIWTLPGATRAKAPA